ncbi:MAG: sporulation protein YqfD [Lachnospiraceae bacterium]|nr:sporulation protein YqfD [Lachnospiraceae bacterium]
MTHRMIGWLLGILYVRAEGNEAERFVNLCRNHGIVLWGLSVDEKRKGIYFYISLKDFYRLRKIVRKSKVFVVVKRRIGFPFFIQYLRKNISFFAGVFCMFGILILLSSRIWSIEVSGQSYHTQESIVKYLNKKGIYCGMAKSELSCQGMRELLRKKYRDIGWISVEETGSCIHIRIKEVQMVEKEEEQKKGHLVADADGTVVSIVTRKGTARVKAGKKVKKGDILISGVVNIKGDGEVLVGKDYVHAEGDVILKEEENYREELPKNYKKKEYTGRERKIYEWDFFDKKFFLYNPLNNLESYEKYDIIREVGLLCPEVSLRFPVKSYVKLFREIRYVSAGYHEEEAERILEEHYEDYIREKKEAGYGLVRTSVRLAESEGSYFYQGHLVFYRKQEKYRTIHKKG